MGFEKMMQGISETVNAGCFQTFAIVFRTPEILLVGISGAICRKVFHSLCKNVFCENAVGPLRNRECWTFKPLPFVFSTQENFYNSMNGCFSFCLTSFIFDIFSKTEQ